MPTDPLAHDPASCDGSQDPFEHWKNTLHAINQTTDNYLWLYNRSDDTILFFGGAEDVFDLGEKQAGDRYRFQQWLDAVHEDGIAELTSDIDHLASGAARAHDMNYRVKNTFGTFTWINSKQRACTCPNKRASPVSKDR